MRNYVLVLNYDKEEWCNTIVRFEAVNMIEAKIEAKKLIEQEKKYMEREYEVEDSDELYYVGSIYEYVDMGQV
jgi:hypothetical protein